MNLYRICNTLYSEDISGTGAKMFGGRWNSRGIEMLYVTEHISLAVLEMLVHNEFKDFSIPLSLVVISLPESAEVREIKLAKMRRDWISDPGYTRFIGDGFIQSAAALLMKVPSAVITDEHNFLINPQHPDFKKIRIAESKTFETDKRLLTV